MGSWRSWAIAPDELFVSTGFELASDDEGYPVGSTGQPSLYLAPAYSGAPDRVDDVLRPLRDLGPAIDTVAHKRYLDVQSMSDETMAWGKRFYMKGAFLPELSDALIERGMAAMETAPSRGCAITAWRQGGAISRIPDDAMAFNGRSAAFWIAVETEWDDAALDEAHVAWGRSTMEALKPFTTAGHYVNDVVESGDDVVRAIYGAEKYERLVGLKRTYDPDNVFRLNQNVRP